MSQEEYSGASADAISHHYDVSNDFYRLWLDPSCSYTNAMWGPDDDLAAAQQRKTDYLITEAQLQNAQVCLDVGCGWGSTLARLVTHFGAQRAVGLTLSKQQAEYVNGMDLPGVEVREENWIDHQPQELYDGITIAGCLEHFARPGLSRDEKVAGYRRFFKKAHEWIKPGGYMALQTMAYGNMSDEAFRGFFDTDIFPESNLPRLGELAQAAEGLFEVMRLRNDRLDYERTCNEWLANLRRNREEIVALVGEEVYKRYEKYLGFSSIGFNREKVEALRFTLRRIDQPFNAG